MKKLRIVVGGFLGILPAGGITWDYVQYPLGFSLLGHDVYYIEDTRLFPIYQKPGSNWDDASSCVQHLSKVMEYFGMGNRWAYRDEASGNCFGLSAQQVSRICKTADVFVNISCSTFLRDEYMKIPARVLIDSDPMFTQIQYLSQQMFTPGTPSLRQLVDGHNYLFTFGESIGTENCLIPDCNLKWIPTRQPVCLPYWKVNNCGSSSAFSFTTLMNWTAAKKLYYNGEEWGQKDVEFKKVFNLPQKVAPVCLSAVVNQTGGTDQTFSKQSLEKAGWKILDPDSNAGSWQDYQHFIGNSFGEFSVAKETYVKGNTGWFSCRSACYLASGKPVVTQETGWSAHIPSGEGLFAFSDAAEASEAIRKVVAQSSMHSKKARAIAVEYFDSDKVLDHLLLSIN